VRQVPEKIDFSKMKELAQLADQCATKMVEYNDKKEFKFQEIADFFARSFLDQYKAHLSEDEVDISIPGENIRPVVDTELLVQQFGLDLVNAFFTAVNTRMSTYNHKIK
jgi:hypothetical protein